ncbi:uncharacterized protein LOC109708854 isoform X3 [Ananas comosus]|uniref:Uncharacterized protein LOC109708854 isoform X3 n=1 Tax=Ananas comosus TaxID=4615 RepID=A0A6P5EYV9_ANACO|nr:uncharacterized protein LOC109708854 isoform X3 [Ananas comosus]
MASFVLPHPAWGFAPHHSNYSSKTLIAPSRSSKPFKPSSPAAAAAAAAPEGGGGGGGPPEEAPPDPLKLAFAKAAAYKKAKISSAAQTQEQTLALNRSNGGDGGGGKEAEAPDTAKLAMERAREYKTSKGATNGGGDASVEKLTTNSVWDLQSLVKKNKKKRKEDEHCQELQTSSISADGRVDKKVSKKEESKISKIDFLGLEFSEKKRYRGAPPGLAPIVDPFTDGDVREVEIIVGDSTKFENTAPSKVTDSEKDDNTGLYKPKVSTWGVFPRPGNISKTYGGGRNIQPGQVLEAAEDRAKKEKRTEEFIAAYKSKMGLTIDPKIKAACEKALKEGDKLMGVGKLREALPFYEKVMKDLVFQSELHGMAALQWSVCQDSLSRRLLPISETGFMAIAVQHLLNIPSYWPRQLLLIPFYPSVFCRTLTLTGQMKLGSCMRSSSLIRMFK